MVSIEKDIKQENEEPLNIEEEGSEFEEEESETETEHQPEQPKGINNYLNLFRTT